MKNLILTFTAFILLASFAAQAAPEIGKQAPNIKAQTLSGETFDLSAHKGKMVVLEWTNHQCPYVIKHYDTGNMQNTQEKAREMGAEWITIISSAPGMQGHVSAEKAREIADESGASPSAIIRDENGEIGQLYSAKTTPHMFVIDTEGMLVYAGAIDDAPSPRHSTVEGAENYVLAALESLKAGTPVETAQTKPYGCAVKYAP